MTMQPIGRVSQVPPIKDPNGNVVTQDAYDTLVDEYDEVRAKYGVLEEANARLGRDLTELRRRFGIVEKLPEAGHVEVPGEGGDIIKRPVLLKRLVLAALHGDIEEVPG